ncbi:hypothetical protein E2C01_093841 [Portunus trituberculatus]|uniref:Uncharacterized protein n=1 Tax=Portunus trituberculatus TaxID=210409 RepID=A0A5B7JUK0_PORTR|nr:hypothetical protein [Portunus trituberculatus]
MGLSLNGVPGNAWLSDLESKSVHIVILQRGCELSLCFGAAVNTTTALRLSNCAALVITVTGSSV